MDNHASMPSESQEYPHHYQHYQQQQQQPEATNPNAYDPSTQAYYASYQQYNQVLHQQQEAQPDYSSYYYPDYSNSYQSHPQADPSSIHPPGVTIPAETPQNLVQNHPGVHYSHGFVNLQQQQPQNGFMAPSYSTFAARGGHGDRSIRGGRHSSSRGRGKGRGRGGTRGTASANYGSPGIPRQVPQPSSSIPGQATRMAWCEICRVNCNTPEVLEQHKNGKKHKKYLKVYEELQNAKLQVGLQNPQTQVSNSDAVSGNDNGVDTAKSSGAQNSEEREQIGVTRGGLKRKVKGGHGGKLMKSNDGSRKPAQSSKPKKAVDLFCSLCSVKCESQVVYNSHMVGKKHLSNVKKFQGHGAAMGSSGVQALNPPIPKIPTTLQTLYPPTLNIPSAPSSTQDNQQRLIEPNKALASTSLVNAALYPPTFNIPSAPSSTQYNQRSLIEPNKALASTSLVNNQRGDVQDTQAKLVQILNQHGIQDAQSLLSQMIPVLLNQVLPNGATPNVTGLVTQDQQNSVARVSSGENVSKPETVVSESVQKTKLSGGAADKSSMGSLVIQAEVIELPAMTATNSTEQASVDGRQNELVAG